MLVVVEPLVEEVLEKDLVVLEVVVMQDKIVATLVQTL